MLFILEADPMHKKIRSHGCLHIVCLRKELQERQRGRPLGSAVIVTCVIFLKLQLIAS
jgi:hypothetical protein